MFGATRRQKPRRSTTAEPRIKYIQSAGLGDVLAPGTDASSKKSLAANVKPWQTLPPHRRIERVVH